MKKLISFILSFALVSVSFLNGQSEIFGDQFSKRWSIDVTLGGVIISPNGGMEDLMHKYGFDGNSSGFFNVDYPVAEMLPTLEISLAHLVSNREEIGGYIAFSKGHTAGNHNDLNTYLKIQHFNYRTGVFYRFYPMTRYLHVQGGVSMNIGEFYRDSYGARGIARASSYMLPGLSAGVGLSFIENPKSHLRMTLGYHIIPQRIIIGPYWDMESTGDPADPKNDTYMIFPEERVLAQELTLKLTYGWRFKSWDQ